MKAGLEVHQQLATRKLFCDCPPELSDEVTGEVVRRLRAASGEDHHVDAAAALQAARGLTYRYETVRSSCLVELDEEPPHELNPEALDVALTMALLLDARPLDEVEVMRKIVVDGSNTAGFQRTALVAVDGSLSVNGRTYSIPSICLEEDAARKTEEATGELTYRLDRLGIPLIEIATGPEITSGPEARDVAEEIGALLRSTKKVRRGIGSIREDLNVSIDGGQRIEIKGVQELRLIHRYVECEVERQELLLAVRDRLKDQGAMAPTDAPTDLTDFFESLSEGPLGTARRKGGRILGLVLRGFAGSLKSSEGSFERLGRELADYARSAGTKGLIHSDELPGFGIDESTLGRLREKLKAGTHDAFVLVADSEARAHEALRRVSGRARVALEGIPPETRDPLPDGHTRYSRPLPGRDRMYPETDVPPLTITTSRVRQLREHLPERPATVRERLQREYSLPPEVVRQIEGTGNTERFESLARQGHSPLIVARLLTQELPVVEEDSGEGPRVEVSPPTLEALLRAIGTGEFAKEGIPLVLAEFAVGAPSISEAIRRAGFAVLSVNDLERLVTVILDRNEALIRERGLAAFSPLMGDVMREVRGRRDGEEVAEALRRSLDRRVAPKKP